MKKFTVLLFSIGLFIHLYTALFKSSEIDMFGIALMIWSWTPYFLIWLIAIRRGRYIRAFIPTLFVLIVDLLLYTTVFHFPSSSTASLGLLWAPLWNLMLVVPVGIFVGIGIERYRKSEAVDRDE